MTEDEARSRAKQCGMAFIRNLRRRFRGARLDSGIDVRHASDGTWFVQWCDGKIVGGGHGRDGERVMVAGGEVVGSPVSAKPIYEAMDAHGFYPSKSLTPYGRDAQIAWALTTETDMRYRVTQVCRPSGHAPRRATSNGGGV